jgi:hypothetical protein
LAIGLTLAFHGCVPVRFSGYHPSGSGTVESGFCIAGIKDFHRAQVDAGVQILTRASQNTLDNTIQLRIELVVPAGVTVELLPLELVGRSPQWKDPQILRVREIGPYVATENFQIRGAAGDLGYFRLGFVPRRPGQTTLPNVETFSLQFPALRVDGRMYHIDDIEFRAYKEWGMPTCIQ